MSNETTTTTQVEGNKDEGIKESSTEGQKVTDEFGYETVNEEKAKEESEVADSDEAPASGYEKPPEEPPAEEKPKEEVKEKTKVEASPDDDELGIIDTNGLLPDEVTELKEFAKAHKLPKNVIKAMVESKKAEIAKAQALIKSQEKEIEQTRLKIKKQWHDELLKDPHFGGEKFNHSVKRVNKLLNEFLVETKNKLTEAGSMLPPYVMRDLAKLADRVYKTESFTQGEPPKPKEEPKENDPLAFYNT